MPDVRRQARTLRKRAGAFRAPPPPPLPPAPVWSWTGLNSEAWCEVELPERALDGSLVRMHVVDLGNKETEDVEP